MVARGVDDPARQRATDQHRFDDGNVAAKIRRHITDSWGFVAAQ
jgi:hypothetical protein